MNLHDLRPTEGSRTAPKRLGRGTGSGLGKTSGKGHKVSTTTVELSGEDGSYIVQDDFIGFVLHLLLEIAHHNTHNTANSY